MIAPVNAEDLDEVVALEADGFADRRWSRDAWADELASPRAGVFAARDSATGALVGVITLSQAADILVREFGRFAEIGRPATAGVDAAGPIAPSANLLDAPIEELDLPMRAYNSLKRNSITKIGQVLSLSDDEFLRMRNFGQKSLDELKERLALRGFISPDATSMSADESDLPASAELDEAAAAELDREA